MIAGLVAGCVLLAAALGSLLVLWKCDRDRLASTKACLAVSKQSASSAQLDLIFSKAKIADLQIKVEDQAKKIGVLVKVANGDAK